MSVAVSLAAVTGSSYYIPFWIQLLAIILAPGLAFFGVFFGASLSARHEDRKWLRDQRRETYFEFALAARSWGHRCRIFISDAFALSDPSVAIAAAGSSENDSSYNDLIRRHDYLRLIAEEDVIMVAKKVFSLGRDMAEMANDRAKAAEAWQRQPDFEYLARGQEWLQVVDDFFNEVDKFVVVARRSLLKSI